MEKVSLMEIVKGLKNCVFGERTEWLSTFWSRFLRNRITETCCKYTCTNTFLSFSLHGYVLAAVVYKDSGEYPRFVSLAKYCRIAAANTITC